MIGTIYKLTDKDGKVYYGSTIRKLCERLCQHKTKTKQQCMTRLMDKESMTIEALEEYYFDEDTYNKKFMLQRERYYIENNECINRYIPGRTKNKKVYYEKNKESIIKKRKEYREENKESIAEKARIKYEKNKQSINEKAKEKVGCRICKSMIRRYDFAAHTKTKKHQSNLIASKC